MSKSVTGLGHSLHLQTTELINEFLATVQKEHFQYLQEILEEAKKTFGRLVFYDSMFKFLEDLCFSVIFNSSYKISFEHFLKSTV